MKLQHQHCEAKTKPHLLNDEEIQTNLSLLPHWKLNKEDNNITRELKFKDYHQTLLFINSIATIIHRENHHPDIKFGYNTCKIFYSTHSAKGVTLFDFICAAHIEQILLKPEFNI